jgi:hypothetical protein
MLESEGQCTYIRVCLVCVCVWEEGRDAQRHTQYIQNFISRSLLLRLVTSRGKRVSVQTRLRIKLRLVKTSRCAVTLQVHFHPTSLSLTPSLIGAHTPVLLGSVGRLGTVCHMPTLCQTCVRGATPQRHGRRASHSALSSFDACPASSARERASERAVKDIKINLSS